jgi:hypothetical protein
LDPGDVEAEDGGTLYRHWFEEPLFKSKFVRELAPLDAIWQGHGIPGAPHLAQAAPINLLDGG